ncbi:hypothetical protein [Actinomadura sp. 3N407]|uniref:hypothetical protein n=1 Tax=Actinomadura sp. 3N407 TaxID=3457423 RepID=UPI003FCEBD02
MGVEDNTDTDTRTETTDEPASQERPNTPPDNPGSPGQPSRPESLARAREEQPATAAQRNETGDGRDGPTGERDARPASAGSENGSDTPQMPNELRPGEAGRPDEHGEQPDPRDNGVPAGDQQTSGPGDRDRPAGQAPEEPADTRAPDTDQPPAHDHKTGLDQFIEDATAGGIGQGAPWPAWISGNQSGRQRLRHSVVAQGSESGERLSSGGRTLPERTPAVESDKWDVAAFLES